MIDTNRDPSSEAYRSEGSIQNAESGEISRSEDQAGTAFPDSDIVHEGVILVSKQSDEGLERSERGDESTPEEPRERMGKRGKLEFSEFARELERAVVCKSTKDQLPEVIKLIKAGYRESLSSNQLEVIFTLLKTWPGSDRLAIELSLLTRQKRQPELMRSLRNRLLAYSRERVEYPETEMRRASEGSRRDVLLGWIERNTSPIVLDGGAKADSLNLEWFRWAVVCLMEETPNAAAYPLYAILDAFVASTKKQADTELEGMDLLLEMGHIFASNKPVIPKLEAGRKFASAARASERLVRGELARARSNLENRNAQISERDKRVGDLEMTLSASRDRISELETALEHKTKEVELEKDERNLDKQHWKELSEQRRVRMANEIAHRLTHEIKEASFCLSDESPNIRMALNRLKQMEKWLLKLSTE